MAITQDDAKPLATVAAEQVLAFLKFAPDFTGSKNIQVFAKYGGFSTIINSAIEITRLPDDASGREYSIAIGGVVVQTIAANAATLGIAEPVLVALSAAIFAPAEAVVASTVAIAVVGTGIGAGVTYAYNELKDAGITTEMLGGLHDAIVTASQQPGAGFTINSNSVYEFNPAFASTTQDIYSSLKTDPAYF